MGDFTWTCWGIFKLVNHAMMTHHLDNLLGDNTHQKLKPCSKPSFAPPAVAEDARMTGTCQPIKTVSKGVIDSCN